MLKNGQNEDNCRIICTWTRTLNVAANKFVFLNREFFSDSARYAGFLTVFAECTHSEPVFPNFSVAQESIQGINSAGLCSLAGRYDNPTSTRFLAPTDCLKIPALNSQKFVQRPREWVEEAVRKNLKAWLYYLYDWKDSSLRCCFSFYRPSILL